MSATMVFPFLGSHARALGRDALREALADGFVPVALDSEAIELAGMLTADVSVLDDWLAAPTRAGLRRQAVAATGSWFEAARDTFTVDGHCWPMVDRFVQVPYWEEWALQVALEDAFVAAGVDRMRFPLPVGGRPSVAFAPADTWGHLWAASDRLAAEPLPVTMPATPLPRRAASKGARVLRAAPAVRSLRRPARGAVAIAVNEGECHRFEPLVVRLRAAGLPVVGCLLGWDIATALAWTHRWGVPVLARGRVPDAPVAERLAGGVDAVAATNSPWGVACRSAPFQHRWLATARWPQLVAQLAGWRRRWERLRPRAVVVSSLETAESQLPAIAARELGIPTWSAPHGGWDHKFLDTIEVDEPLCETPMQVELYRIAGVDVPARRAAPLLRHDEYAARGASTASHRVVTLTNPVSYAPERGVLDPWVTHRDQLAGLAHVAAVGARLRDDAEIVVKPHPGYPDEALLRHAGVAALESTVPLDDLAASADAVVALNYVGSALGQLAAIGAPMLLHITSAELRAHPVLQALATSLPVTTTAEELHDALYAVLADPAAAADARARTAAFRARWLDGDEPAADVAEVLTLGLR